MATRRPNLHLVAPRKLETIDQLLEDKAALREQIRKIDRKLYNLQRSAARPTMMCRRCKKAIEFGHKYRHGEFRGRIFVEHHSCTHPTYPSSLLVRMEPK